MAPMEGITGYIYRNTYNRHFRGVDKFFTPFIAPAKGRPLRTRELKDILPENNRGLNVVPQILTNDADDFIKTAKYLKEYGYTEVNINLGCPSGTVVSKCKGAGMLYDIERLDHFLYNIYEADIMPVSIKTRIGKLFPEEFEDIISVYKKYPVAELIIHPRIQTDYYKNTPNMEIFKSGVRNYVMAGYTEKTCCVKGKDIQGCRSNGSNHSIEEICYNGDIIDLEGYNCFAKECPDIPAIMLGRGLIGNPFLPEMIKKESKCMDSAQSDIISHNDNEREKCNRLKSFHDELLETYRSSDLGDNNTLFKMKELWLYMGSMFTETPDAAKYLKRIKKSKNMEEYKSSVNDIMGSLLS
ncbi:MAG: tRNA dihydrouridine synthase [Coprococcus sp.]